MKKINVLLILSVMAGLTACHTSKPLHVCGVERTRLLVDNRYDASIPAELTDFLAPYAHIVDSVSSPIVGHTTRTLRSGRPESPLSNLLADIMVWAGPAFDEKPDLGVYNMGGIRAALPKGAVNYGNVVDMAPFDNYISFLTLSGEELLELFRQIAANGGEGVSHGVQLVITPDGQLVSASLHGRSIDPAAHYRIATIDFLAKGNDGLIAFKKKRDYRIPSKTNTKACLIIADYFRAAEAAGQTVDTQVEGRITVAE